MVKIIFAGIHKETLPLLCEDFEVSAVAHIDFFSKGTLNPFNFIFKLIYYLRRKDRLRFIEIILLKVWTLTKFLSSTVFCNYSDFLEIVSRKKIKVLDFSHRLEIEKYIKNNKIDLLVVNTWEMLPDNIIFSPRLGTVNVHPSMLPRYRGALPTLWSLKNMDSESAITYMLLDKSMDGGKILKQHRFDLDDDENWFSIEKKATDVIRKTIAQDLLDFVSGKIIAYSQDNSIVSFTDKYEAYRRIDWEKEKGRDVYNKINIYPFVEPGVFFYTYYKNSRIYIKGATLCEKQPVDINKNRFFICERCLCIMTDDGIIKVKLFRDLDFLSSVRIFFDISGLDFNLSNKK